MKSAKLAKWREICNGPPPMYPVWSDDEENKLQELKKLRIDLSDTALGRYEAQKKIELEVAAEKLTKEERDNLRKKLDEFDDTEVTEKKL